MARWRWGDGYGAGTGVIVPARPHLPGCACCGPAPIGRRQVLQGLAAGGALAALSACTTNPATGRQSYTGFYSLKDDIKLGREEHPKLVKEFGGPYEHGKLNGYVTSVGKRLAAHSEHPELPYSFTILDTPIVNAFALPGGYVHVSRGLLALASNEAELAGVLAHEIGHVNARHTAERLAAAQAAQFGLLLGSIGAAAAGLPSQVMDVGQTVATLAIQGYSRQQEMEADMLGVRYMSQAGYDPNAMVSFL
ncbi:MAG TPA: M48 family metalloprotease, partial [Alphaproteobacteria bacterium]|nr:M48 family metalloprotease [Alphaproteobacteria bacterium]